MHHSEQGSAGLVLNRPTTRRIGQGRTAEGLAIQKEVSVCACATDRKEAAEASCPPC